MLFIKKHIWNIIFVVLFCIVVKRQLPVWQNSLDQQGKIFQDNTLKNLDGDFITIPVKGERKVYLFWATWCSPCHIQMNFFKKAVENGKLKQEQIIAVSLGEELSIVKKFQEEKRYPFTILVSEKTFKDFNVQVTPSIAYINEEGKVYEFTSGIAPLAVYKSRKFLN